MTHGLRSFMDCEIPDCVSCLSFVERRPIPEKRGNWISTVGTPRNRPKLSLRDKKHPSSRAYNEGCRCEDCRALNSKRLEKYRPPARKRRQVRC